jgi:hypothetical protein
VVEKSQKKTSAQQKPLVISRGLGEGVFQTLMATEESRESATTQTAREIRVSCVAKRQNAGGKKIRRPVVNAQHLGAQPVRRASEDSIKCRLDFMLIRLPLPFLQQHPVCC